jgi:tetratricopeptide (TPR) repeat protein
MLIFFLAMACRSDAKKEYAPIKSSESKIFVSDKLISDSEFLGDASCKECHEDEFNLWQGSHHDKAMQVASRETILADFNGESFTSQGVTSRFFQKDGAFYANTEGPDGSYHDYKVIYAFGITPLQQYIVQFPNGHYQCLRTAWDTEKNKWFDLYPDFKVVHSEWLHWSRGGLNWNNMCADCHSTNVRKNYDHESHSYDTEYALINVSCEACHGPGKQHVADAERLGDSYKDTGTMHMTFGTMPHDLVDQCARCHMRREQVSEFFNFEGTMLDHYFPQLIVEPTYFPDGQILDEDYVYASFVQSKMYKNNIMCSNCHDSHSLKLKFEGNTLCAQCHLVETYDTPEHHFHEMGTEGAQCISCHMTGRYYMGNDFRRDHSFRIPRPDQSLKFDTPNACSQCHDDKSVEWAWEKFKEQYGEPDYVHFSDLLAPGLRGHEGGFESLVTLARDTVFPEIARASAVRGMSMYLNQENVREVIQYLNDESPLVRATSLDVLAEINSPDYVNYFIPLLKDPKRAVRVRAFFALGLLHEADLPEEYREAYKKVAKEFNTSLAITSDFAGGWVKNANYQIKKGNIGSAITSYETALEIDNLNNMARTNLANLYYNNGEHDKAVETFQLIIDQEPEYGPTYYSLGLLYAELERTKEAITELETASKLMPDNIRVYYNLSLLYDKDDQSDKSESTLLRGLKIAPQNESLLYALAFHYAKLNDLRRAENIALKLIEYYPENTQYQTFLKQIRQQ